MCLGASLPCLLSQDVKDLVSSSMILNSISGRKEFPKVGWMLLEGYPCENFSDIIGIENQKKHAYAIRDGTGESGETFDASAQFTEENAVHVHLYENVLCLVAFPHKKCALVVMSQLNDSFKVPSEDKDLGQEPQVGTNLQQQNDRLADQGMAVRSVVWDPNDMHCAQSRDRLWTIALHIFTEAHVERAAGTDIPAGGEPGHAQQKCNDIVATALAIKDKVDLGLDLQHLLYDDDSSEVIDVALSLQDNTDQSEKPSQKRGPAVAKRKIVSNGPKRKAKARKAESSSDGPSDENSESSSELPAPTRKKGKSKAKAQAAVKGEKPARGEGWKVTHKMLFTKAGIPWDDPKQDFCPSWYSDCVWYKALPLRERHVLFYWDIVQPMKDSDPEQTLDLFGAQGNSANVNMCMCVVISVMCSGPRPCAPGNPFRLCTPSHQVAGTGFAGDDAGCCLLSAWQVKG